MITTLTMELVIQYMHVGTCTYCWILLRDNASDTAREFLGLRHQEFTLVFFLVPRNLSNHMDRQALDPSLLSFLVVPLVRELQSTRSCDFLNRVAGSLKVFLEGSGVLNR
jgi:hypothetical protein